MGKLSLVARVRALVERAGRGGLTPVEHASLVADVAELRARLSRLAALGYADAAQLSPELEALSLPPVAATEVIAA